jgi:hypothetical protein
MFGFFYVKKFAFIPVFALTNPFHQRFIFPNFVL